jgi:predicted dehydrogenase
VKPVRIAIIGAGNWGRNHVRTVAGLPEARLAAVCELDDMRRAAVERQFPSVTVTRDLEVALAAADAVVVATSATAHSEVARAAIERGLPTLVEKPFALSVPDAEELADLSARRGVPVLVGHLLVYHPAVERLKQMIRVGELGELLYLYSQRVNLGQVRPDENALWSFGPHDVSVALELVEATVTRVSAHGHSYLQPGIEDVVFLHLEFETGVMAHAQMSWLDPHKERRLTAVGSRKMVVFDDMHPREKLKVYDKGVERPPEYASYGESLAIREGDILIPKIANVEPLAAELRHFVAVARGEAEPRSPASAGVAVTRVLAAATESLRRGGQLIDVMSGEVAV